ncbi:MAG: hypothetical protein KY475_24815, partial [Planctomycetes bacterium]|nr:hypothetical protein [Planctomycetota bacterium]
MHLLLSAHGDDATLLDEIRGAIPDVEASSTDGVGSLFRTRQVAMGHMLRPKKTPDPFPPGLIALDGVPADKGAPSAFAFARQMLPDANALTASSVKAWAKQVCDAVLNSLSDDQPWRMHVFPFYGPSATAGAGERRCRFIRDSVAVMLKEKRRRMLRRLSDATTPFQAEDSFVQLMLASPAEGFLSIVPAPWPHELRRLVWPFPAGEVPVASDKSAPSRAFAKLLEAELRLGRRIAAGETCVDLGAAPGSWSYVAVQRAADVTAIDRSPLREDLMRHPRLRFHRGDAFNFAPEQPVDWLPCDVIAAPQRSIDLLLDWA